MKYIKGIFIAVLLVVFLFPVVSVAELWTPAGFSWGDIPFTLYGKTSGNLSFININEYEYVILHEKRIVFVLYNSKAVGLRAFYGKNDYIPRVRAFNTSEGQTRKFTAGNGIICIESVLGNHKPFKKWR